MTTTKGKKKSQNDILKTQFYFNWIVLLGNSYPRGLFKSVGNCALVCYAMGDE